MSTTDPVDLQQMVNSMSIAEREQLAQYHSLSNFLLLHKSQFDTYNLSDILREQIYTKCYNIESAINELESLITIQLVEETTDCGDELKSDETHNISDNSQIDNKYYQAVVNNDIAAPHHNIYIVPHLWNTVQEDMITQLHTIDGLLDRVWSLCNIEFYLLHTLHYTAAYIQSMTVQQKSNLLLKYLFDNRYIQSYLTTTPKSTTQRIAELNADDVQSNYYLNDEYGCAIQQTNNTALINARLENFVCITQNGISLSLLWFIKPINTGGTIYIQQKSITPCPMQLDIDVPSITGTVNDEVDDVQVIASNANVSIEQAREALEKYGNVTDAIVELTSQPQQ